MAPTRKDQLLATLKRGILERDRMLVRQHEIIDALLDRRDRAIPPDQCECTACWYGMAQIGPGDWTDCPECKGQGMAPRPQLGIDDFEGFCPLPP